MMNPTISILFFFVLLLTNCVVAQESQPAEPLTTPQWTHPKKFLSKQKSDAWPTVKAEHRPGAIWWWPASAVSKGDVTWNLNTYAKAGWGNMSLVGIYGVKGEEKRTIELFTPRWFEMYNHTSEQAAKLGMNIDLTPGGGWRWGGPHVTPEFAEDMFRVRDGKLKFEDLRDKVKRAGPGGIGMTVNPYSEKAVQFHLDWFDEKMKGSNALAPRAFYYDSFENRGNWCDELPDEFLKRRGYSINDHLEVFGREATTPQDRRILADYRQTLSEMLIERLHQIADWGEGHGSSLRIQAHGSPANLLDLYAAGGIPETEVFGASRFDIPGFRREQQWIRADQQSDLVNRFASSAAHVAGRALTTSESFTWLRNHYHVALSQIKAEADGFFLNGINGIFYHGACFSPRKTQWPGWLFYASTQANPRNSIFRDVPILNAYITRCQSVLQSGKPHNDILLYWPVYDLWNSGGKGEMRFAVHHPEWIEESLCGEAGRLLLKQGFSFDLISDAQLLNTAFDQGQLRTEGESRYQTLLVPAAKYMPLATAKRIRELADAGATVLVWKSIPEEVPGWHDHVSRKEHLAEVWQDLPFDRNGVAQTGSGKIVVQSDLKKLLAAAPCQREAMTDLGLEFIRREIDGDISYFVVNHTAETIDRWVPLTTPCRSVAAMDPMSGKTGSIPLRVVDETCYVYLQMRPGETRVLRTSQLQTEANKWTFTKARDQQQQLTGPWQLKFIQGGPDLPQDATMETLCCWTRLDDEKAKAFAGACCYSTEFEIGAGNESGWRLELGDVRESARVWVDDKPVGCVVAHPFELDLGVLRPGKHTLKVEVTNLSANRIRDLDIRGVNWKKFHDINFVTHLYKPFDASQWELKPSGLLGPVTLTAYDEQTAFPASVSSRHKPRKWYVATDGRDDNDGSIERPFATIRRAQQFVAPGDTVLIRGGTYRVTGLDRQPRRRIITAIHHLNRSGLPGKPITYRNYPGERPVFDCSAVTPPRRRVDAFHVSASWIHLIGIEVTGVQVTMKRHTQSICFHNEGSHNIYERLKMHDNQAIGVYSVRGSNNLFLNCDAWNNRDYTSEDGLGGNVDGFGCHPLPGDTGNVFRGCRAWNNSDDGFDCINAFETVVFENCWAMRNGLSPSGKRLADGNGFKVGGFADRPLDQLPNPVPRHHVKDCIAAENKNSGFYANHHPGGNDWLSNIAIGNGINFNMLSRMPDSYTDVDGYSHRLIDNISIGKDKRLVRNMDKSKCELSGNSFQLAASSRADVLQFSRLEIGKLQQPRTSDGELPALN